MHDPVNKLRKPRGRTPPPDSAGRERMHVAPGNVRTGKSRLTAVLGFRALWDEGLLSMCLVCAIAAVAAPIMILAGLKFGFIEISRSKFIQDPSFRLIT